jgi:hypothetical protein
MSSAPNCIITYQSVLPKADELLTKGDTGGEPPCPRCEERQGLLQWQERHERKVLQSFRAGREAMSLKPQEIGPIPEETTRVARAAYPKGNVFMRMRDELGPIYQDEAFAHLFSPTGQPAEAPWRLALVTVTQFARSAFPIVRQPMRCGDGSTLSMRLSFGTHRPRLRSYRTGRISSAFNCWERRTTAVGHDADAL